MTKIKKCLNYGGQTRTGKPCKKSAGNGTGHPGIGRCSSHDSVGRKTMQAKKTQFLETYGSGTITTIRAAMLCGVDQATIWRWRVEDEEFNKECKKVKLESLSRRLELVEESTFNRVLAGNARDTLHIYWMDNVSRQIRTAKDDWIKTSHVTLAGDEDNPLTPVFVIPDVLELAEWAQRYTEKKEDAA